MLAPLARMLVAHGVTYPQLAQALKPVFLEAAKAELAESDKAPTDSALSLLSGVHRKDVRALSRSRSKSLVTPSPSLSFAAEVATRWVTDRKYLDDRGRPKRLPIRSEKIRDRTFETLAQSVSKDFHPHSVLDELTRLGIAKVKDDTVSLLWREFAPADGFKENAHFLRVNVQDHLAAATENMRSVGQSPDKPFLEHAVFADEISQESAKKLEKLARKLWSVALRQWLTKALILFEADQSKPPSQRMARTRFGAYTFVEPELSGETVVRRSSRGRSQ